MPTAAKVQLIGKLIDAGIRRMEVASFVAPKRVPQMADAEDVVSALPVRGDCTYIGLALNMRGATRALSTQVDEIATAVPATDSFGIRNQGQTRDESLLEVAGMVSMSDRPVLGAIAMAFGCPFEGRVPHARVLDTANRLADLGIAEIALADTIGVAVPAEISDLFGLIAGALPEVRLRAHFHDTRNTGMANVWAAVGAGVGIIDASIAGLGGCPFAPGATGNVATEDVAYLIKRSGLRLSATVEELVHIARDVDKMLGRSATSGLSRAGLPTGDVM